MIKIWRVWFGLTPFCTSKNVVAQDAKEAIEKAIEKWGYSPVTKVEFLAEAEEQVTMIVNIPIDRLVIFSIIMENGDGIIGKSPDYILEKFASASTAFNPEGLLDEKNRKKLEKWRRRWCLVQEA
jgi:hypothetical protein